ncbi:hypothetical protein [Streptomyces roseoviridis]|uniref:Uncharacterized protein n=1 Tax=Streptomyces roseoviridis TaxID=67361 RepID=A0ABV5QSJ7_9ACTN
MAAPVRVGTSGWNVMTLISRGDADRDARTDLLARDIRNGDRWLYRGSDDGGSTRVPSTAADTGTATGHHGYGYGYGYGTLDRLLFPGRAGADRNGVADLGPPPTDADDGRSGQLEDDPLDRLATADPRARSPRVRGPK